MTPPIGARVRAVRQARGLSLRKLAEAVGVSPSLISQIENGKTQPSVQTLYAIVNHLDLSVDELMEVPPRAAPAAAAEPAHAGPVAPPGPRGASPVVQRPDENPRIEMENGVVWERLAGWGDDDVDVILVTYEPGGSSSVEGRLMRHHGTEYAYILEGELTLHLEFDTYALTPGCSLQFSSVRPHMYANNGTTVARGVWFVIGRRDRNALPVVGPAADQADTAAPASFTDVLRVIDESR